MFKKGRQDNGPFLKSDKKIGSNKDTGSDLRENIGTMQDDLAKAIALKNHHNESAGKAKKNGNGDDRDIQRNLAEVYTDGNGQVPDLTKLDKIQRPLWKTILYSLIVIFLVLFVAAAAGFWYFSNLDKETFTNENVTFKLEPPISLVSGQESSYTLSISNGEKVNLYNLNIEMIYPDSFAYSSATPEASGEKKNIWNVGVLKVGETQKLEFRGKIIAPLGSVHTFKGTVTYQPANLNADFKKEIISDLPIASATVSLDLSGPDKIIADQPVEYKIKYKNAGEEDLSDLEIIADYPKGFIFSSSTPDTQAGTNNVWNVAKLASSSEGVITFSGNYSGVAEAGPQEIKARIELKKDNEYLPQNEQTFTTEIVKDQLTLQLIANGSAEDQSVGFGDLLAYTLNFKNNGQQDLRNIQLKANLSSDILDWETLADNNNGKVSGNTITWTGKQVAKLLKLGPGEEGEVSWQIRLKDATAGSDPSISNFSVESYGEAVLSGGDFGSSMIKSKKIVNAINSDLDLAVAARYYNEDNVALGSGPVTPKSGETSSYNIQLALKNNLHNITDIEVSAALPQNVSWDNKENHNLGDLYYNSKTKKITWKVSRLPKTSKDGIVDFNISITPTADDVGKVLILVPEITLIGTDSETGAQINKKFKAITTAFEDPIMGQLDGIVQ